MRSTISLTSLTLMTCLSGCSGTEEPLGQATQQLTVGDAEASVIPSSDWGSGYCTEIAIENQGTSSISDWAITLNLNGSTISNLWNGVHSGGVVTPVSHNATIGAGRSTSFGFCANGSGRPEVIDMSYEGSGSGGGQPPAATCDDGIQNQGETGIDCGGPCAACAPEPTCDDGIQNQGETGIDCGGPCAACTPDPTCDDGIQNQGETDVDCGGPCAACSSGSGGSSGGGSGAGCDGLQSWTDNDWRLSFQAGEIIEYQGARYRANQDIDYPNGQCTPGTAAGWCSNWFSHLGSCDGGSPPVATCNDGIQNQGETGVDCGGPCSSCTPEPTCSDGIQNQGESGVDCGGPCSPCAPTASCDDGVQNQGETGVDCGGPCSACADYSCNGYATRYWDCCKTHCSWKPNVPMSMEPAKVCNANDQPHNNPDVQSACNGGDGYQCHDHAPRAVSSSLSYGYAAVSGGDICGRCYEIEFTGTGRHGNDAGSAALGGKRMVVQAVNVGGDVGSGQFDLLIPGGGVGIFNGCSAQWGVSPSELGAQYGGFLTQCKQQGGNHSQVKQCVRNKCSSVFGSRGLSELEAGCEWFVDWFEAADNPNLRYREVSCPADLSATSNMSRSDSPANACF